MVHRTPGRSPGAPRLRRRSSRFRCHREHAGRGVRVEGYPEPAGSVPAGFLCNGAPTTCEKLRFTRDRMIGEHRWVVTRVVEPMVWPGAAQWCRGLSALGAPLCRKCRSLR